MHTLDQRRAAMAYAHVGDVAGTDEGDRQKYASMVHTFPALLASAGLCQALHFVESRSKESQRLLVQHLARQLQRVDGTIGSPGDLLDRARSADITAYLRLTEEATQCAAWYRRMVQAVLQLEAIDGDRED
jgi:CRISPR-associated protein Cmr5